MSPELIGIGRYCFDSKEISGRSGEMCTFGECPVVCAPPPRCRSVMSQLSGSPNGSPSVGLN